MKTLTTTVYEGAITDGWNGEYIGPDELDDIIEYLRSLKNTDTNVKLTIEVI